MRLLLLSPRFPPTSAADCQRLRMLLPHFSAQGCAVEVLAVDPACCRSPLDPWQAEHLPPGVPIHRVRGLGTAWARLPGLGGLDARCHAALAAAGSALLRRRRFDLVYASTTEFGSFRLGPLWRRRHGLPFVLDLQDPWVNDYYRRHPRVRPPGGRLKYGVVNRLARFHEPRVLRRAAGLTAVSPAYLEQIAARHPFAARLPSLVLPFPGSPDDVRQLPPPATLALPFDPADGLLHWVSVGRGGADLHTAAAGLFAALARHAPAALRRRLRLHFLGTSYAPAGTGLPSIAPLAARFGLAELVEERPDRLPLSTALACMGAADAVLVLGSDDPGYVASKLFPALLARRPLLALLHRDSPARALLRSCGGAVAVPFGSGEAADPLAERIAASWLQHERHRRLVPLDEAAFEPHTAAAQARILVAFLRRCLAP